MCTGTDRIMEKKRYVRGIAQLQKVGNGGELCPVEVQLSCFLFSQDPGARVMLSNPFTEWVLPIRIVIALANWIDRSHLDTSEIIGKSLESMKTPLVHWKFIVNHWRTSKIARLPGLGPFLSGRGDANGSRYPDISKYIMYGLTFWSLCCIYFITLYHCIVCFSVCFVLVWFGLCWFVCLFVVS